MPEAETLNDLTVHIDDAKYPHGICPFMSTVQFIPVQNKLAVNQAFPVPVPGFAPCLGGKCQLWHERKKCSLRPDTDIIHLIDAVRGTLAGIESHIQKMADIYEQVNPI